ncbi:MAG: hypothetical protein AUJ92_02795 [Armatimonadetes bacterium CG2_30_59_28]|nr:hypothetical protein [Armatimonadota bacterium]OIO97869.1 MAG: hypothetical protein AUJ92_02795 [Armatimonadetes bacterium CG2_30_59_28]
MATPVPHKITPVEEQNLLLNYSGKTREQEILSSRPAEVVSLWAHPHSHRNRLYFADNLGVLSSLLHDPQVKGHVRLVYIDPPFATQSSFFSRKQEHAYEDILVGAAFIEFLRKRLVLLRELLATDGSIYLHLDQKMVFHMKIIMDEVFGAENFRNCITRKKCNPKNYTRKSYGNVTDHILFYTKSCNYLWNKPLEPWTDERAKEYQYVEPDTGRRYMKVPVHAPGVRRGETGKPWHGMLPPPGKHWQYPPSRLDEMDARGEIYWSPNGNPRRKVYLDENPGFGVQDIWLDFRDAHNQNIEITGYPTEKNPGLLHRIIQASSRPGDLVLDCFCGSGTTPAVAHELGRYWIGVDNSIEAIRTCVNRFLKGTELMGDFVQARNQQKPEQMDSKKGQASLFDSLEQPGTESVVAAKHQPIIEFEVLSPEDIKSHLNDVVTQLAREVSGVSPPSSRLRVVRDSAHGGDVAEWLAGRDSTLSRLIHRFGPCTLYQKEGGFTYLLDAIVSQQLSMKAAASISHRIRDLFDGQPVTAEAFMKIPDSRLKAAGVSSRKLACLRELGEAVSRGSLPLSSLNSESDDQVIEELSRVKGIGPWTAEMYLLFALARPDVFPLYDHALRKTMGELYGVDASSDAAILEVANVWRPYRSVGRWYLYRHRNAPQDSHDARRDPRSPSDSQTSPVCMVSHVNGEVR